MVEWVEIGDARLALGDCLEILPALDPVDFIFCDPPYGHNNNNGDLIHKWEKALGRPLDCESDPRPIANDGKEATQLFGDFMALVPGLLPPGGCCCCCCGGGGGPDPQYARWSLIMDGPLDFKHMVVWDKGPMGMGWHYRRSYEVVLVGQKRGCACKWYDETGKIENVIRPGSLGVNKIIPQKEHHPTEKPWQLAAHFIRLHSQPGEIVLDPFMGHASTGEAALKLGRKFIGIELDPKFFDVACSKLAMIDREPRLFDAPKAPVCADTLDMFNADQT